MSEQANRLEELMILRASEGLAEAEAAELNKLLERWPDQVDESYELAAAACDLALTSELEECPRELKDEVLGQARDFFAVKAPDADENRAGQVRSFEHRRPPSPSPTTWSWAPWLAAAASLVIAVIGWWPRLAEPPEITPQAERQILLSEARDLIVESWTSPSEDLKDVVSGDVVWSNSLQRGYLRIRGLQANDPRISQYQLWIFDANRDDRFPVDGGVFDVSGDQEIVIPIRAKLTVFDPRLFAVTVEPPGGVVVSRRDPIVLVAEVT